MKDKTLQFLRNSRMGRKLRLGEIPQGMSLDEAKEALMASIPGGEMTEIWGLLGIRVFDAGGGLREDLGLVSTRKITQAFRDYIVDSLQDSTTYPLDVFKHHGSGTGTTSESNSQTDLVTEVESRESGTQTEGSSANIYKSVATHTYGDSFDITEHGLFSASTGGTMLDRSVFSAVGVSDSESIEFTYEATFNAEA